MSQMNLHVNDLHHCLIQQTNITQNSFNVQDYVSDYVSTCSGKKTITSHPGNIKHSQAIMSLLTDLPYYEIKSHQQLQNTAIRLDKT